MAEPSEPGADVPAEADRRLHSGAFSSGLTVPDFAACLGMGMRPVGLVQGFCAMQWAWYGSGSPYMRGMSPYASPHQQGGLYSEVYACPHGFVSADHRAWGQNYEQPWIEQAWAQGYGSAYERMIEEATDAGAHGVIGVADSTKMLSETSVTEFHVLGTAVVVDGAPPPAGGRPWSTFLAGQRLAKLFEAGFAPVSVVASLGSVRVWANCITEYLMEGGMYSWAGTDPREVEQVSNAHMAVREIVREGVRSRLGGDVLHGARMQMDRRELGKGDSVVECRLSGTRVRRFKDFDPLPPAVPTVRLS
jgi:hypothetical protein